MTVLVYDLRPPLGGEFDVVLVKNEFVQNGQKFSRILKINLLQFVQKIRSAIFL